MFVGAAQFFRQLIFEMSSRLPDNLLTVFYKFLFVPAESAWTEPVFQDIQFRLVG